MWCKGLRYLVILALVMTGLCACNTVRGAREDLRRGGERVQNLFRR